MPMNQENVLPKKRRDIALENSISELSAPKSPGLHVEDPIQENILVFIKINKVIFGNVSSPNGHFTKFLNQKLT